MYRDTLSSLLSKVYLFLLFVYECVPHIHKCMMRSPGPLRSQNKVWGATMWMLGTKPWELNPSPLQEQEILTTESISPAPEVLVLIAKK